MKIITTDVKKHLSRDKMFLELDNMASRDSTPLQTWVTFSQIFLPRMKTIFPPLVKLAQFNTQPPALFTGERERAVKGLIVSASPAITSDNEYKMENSI